MPSVRTFWRSLGLALALSVLGLSSAAQAQTPGRLSLGGMDLHLFRPAMDSKGYLSVNGSDILGHLDISFGLIVDGGFGLLPYSSFVNDDNVGPTDAEFCGSGILCGRVVDYLFTGTLHANLGLFNIFEIGLQIPVAFSAGANRTIPTVYNDFLEGMSEGRGADYQGIAGVVIHAKARILRAERNGGFGLGVGLQLEFESPGARAFVGDNSMGLWPMVFGEYRVDRYVRFGLNVGARLMFGSWPTVPVGGTSVPDPMLSSATCGTPMMGGMPRCTTTGGSPVHYGPMLTYGLGAGFRLGDSPIELTAEIFGASIFEAFTSTGGSSLEAMGGLKIFVERNSYLVLSGGAGIPISGLLQADARGMVGFIFEPSIGDRDGDGYRDDTDECPDDPEDFDDFADEDGCSEPDNDRDGILDVDDECPMIPEDRDGDSDEDGCPEGNEGDRDGDGILDADDNCPDDPEDRDGFEDEDGCPDPDNDRDGILDTDDLCPNDPEDRDGWQDEDGCPDPDNDADRILDGDDTCPNDPETYNGTEDEDGCPDRGSVIVTEDSIIILEKIYFETDSAEIQERSFPIIDQVAATLIGNPQITLIEIQGHADERSSDEYNIRLTTDRAAAVLEALVSRGVSRDRLRSAGYGERCPEDPRHTMEAYETNRRVEFKIIATVDGPTGVEVACPAGRELIPR
jgi:outer membrane protein OmpA-like peptidoglycan-associated protein